MWSIHIKLPRLNNLPKVVSRSRFPELLFTEKTVCINEIRVSVYPVCSSFAADTTPEKRPA